MNKQMSKPKLHSWKLIFLPIIILGSVLAYFQIDSRRPSKPQELSGQTPKPNINLGEEKRRADHSPPRASSVESKQGSLMIAQYEKAESLWQLLQDASALSASGDAEAMYLSARILEECGLILATPDHLESHVAYLSTLKPEAKPMLGAALRVREQLCEGISEQIDLVELLVTYQVAAESGSVRAALRSLALGDLAKTSDKSLNRTIQSAIDSGEPDVIFALGDVLGAQVSNRTLDLELPHGTELAGYAWQIAACSMGANCGRSNPVVLESCLSSGACNYPTLPDLYRGEFVSPSDWQRLMLLVQPIVNSFPGRG